MFCFYYFRIKPDSRPSHFSFILNYYTMRVFEETQKFNQWWMYLILALVAIIVLGAVLLMICSRLDTRIDEQGIHVQFFPFMRQERNIAWENIKTIQVRKYSPIGEFGGWGYRGSKKNRAYNVVGNQGLQLELNDGTRLLIGTQKAEELQNLLERYRTKY